MPLQIIRQDITKMKVDAIVNSTNRELLGFSGVDLAIHEAAGQKLTEECKRLAPIEKGKAVVTSGGNLDCKYIIHTCGPFWRGGEYNEKELLENCYISCLHAAAELGCDTIAFPLIASGVYGYPKNLAMKLAVSVITDFLFDHEMTAYLCVFDPSSYEFSKKLFFDITEFIDDVYASEHADAFAGIRTSSTKAPESYKSREIETTAFFAESTSAKSFFSIRSQSLNERIENLDDGFAQTLFRLIDKSGMTDVECYKRANVSRKTFSKIKCDPNYKPSKPTAVAFAIALHLNIDETEAFLKTAGLSLSRSFKFDIIIEYFITHGKYDVFEINEALFEFDQVCLGC